MQAIHETTTASSHSFSIPSMFPLSSGNGLGTLSALNNVLAGHSLSHSHSPTETPKHGSSANLSSGSLSSGSSSTNEHDFLFHGTDMNFGTSQNLTALDAPSSATSTFDELFQHLKSSLPPMNALGSNVSNLSNISLNQHNLMAPNNVAFDFTNSSNDLPNSMNPFRVESFQHQQPPAQPSSFSFKRNTPLSPTHSSSTSSPLASGGSPAPTPMSLTDPVKYNQKGSEEIIGQIIQKKMNEPEEYIDVAPYVTLPQHEAAKKLGIPSSTLSKKWKDATVNRKWPYRALAKIDKEITTLMHNIPRNPDGSAVAMDPELEDQLAQLLKKRQAEARSVIIRLS